MTFNQGRDPVAVVGAACRLPGASSITELWDVLREGRDVVGTIPADRFADESERGRTPGVLRGAGGYLDDITGFDSRYFGVSPFEALRMDPQQRILMEAVWEALADAGIPAESLAGTRTGVYTSLLPSGYWDLLRRAGMYDMHAALGAAIPGIFPGRVSTRLDLRGPSMGVEAACATSLLAVHVACRALWNGEADLAIVGGANLQIVPDLYFALADAGVLSSTGQCRFGDVSGDGYVRSEGVAAVILKPLSRALADGDTPYAVILGSSATHDGRTGGSMVAPGLEGHEEMLRSAYLDAGVAPCDVDYIEAHGPGTRAGDPTELTALDIVLREGRPEDRRCLVGSVKSNLGHTEFNAGLAGLLKTCLAIRHRTIPATLHVDQPHEILRQPYTAVELAMLTQPWPQDERPAIAGISSFGMSGANIHLVLSEAPRPEPRLPAPARPCYVLPVSARDQRALRELAGSYADLLDTGPDLEDLCHTAGVRTTRHELGIAAVGADAAELAAALRQAGEGGYARREPKVVFVFPGQGAQWTGMGRDLLDRLPAFGQHLESCARAVRAELGWSPAELLRQERPLEHVDQIQPTIWAMQVALAAVWREWGVEPDLLIGHSMGEIAAAVISGALSVADGAAVVCRRSRVLRESHARGAMWAIGLGEEAAREAIGDHADLVCVGVINSSHSTVLSGDAAALDEIVAPLLARGVFGKRVQVDYASHAPQVDPMREPLLRELRDLRPEAGTVPIHSTAWDAPVKGEEMDAGYWFENLRLPVRFAAAARAALTQERPTVFVEISPHPLLRPALEDEIEASGARGAVVASLERGRPETDALHAALGRAYELGCRPDWERLYPQGGHLPLPAYPWQRRRFWPDQAGTVLPPEPAAPEQPARTYDLAGMQDTEVAGVVAGLAAQVLAVPGHDIGVDVPLTLLGLDSVLATRFKDRLHRDLGVEVPVRLLLGPSTLLELAARLRAG
ncbi:type I polyketide synthase [Nonomuraea sediminis]|uniref:type I polyketide synthase n=1 Tax=Nonomuraea sediminis TaxID=2835864 RepID=UPI001BDCFE87|nr:type I polyketide synthase [Nonomuraea sediminis]